MPSKEETIIGGPGSFMTVRHLTVSGSNFEIGQRIGQLARERYPYDLSRYASDPVFARTRRLYFQRHYPIHWERVRGVASAFDVDEDDERYDFTNLPYLMDVPLPAGGCSVVYYPPSTTTTSRGYLSRNYDFFIGSMAELMGLRLPTAESPTRPIMSEPYVMEWYPHDGGYPSIAIHAFDSLSGTLDGMNSEGLVVSIMADDEAIAQLGPRLETNPFPPRAVGLHELQLARLLLDTCATAAEAKETLLTVKQYYTFVPNHYIIADRAGDSFVFENSTGRNIQHIIDGQGRPQVVTNFQLYQGRTLEQIPGDSLTLETNAFWRYRTLVDLLAQHDGAFGPEEIRAFNERVGCGQMRKRLSQHPSSAGAAQDVPVRTLWHSIYDQQTQTVDISFYLGEGMGVDAGGDEVRSPHLRFSLGGAHLEEEQSQRLALMSDVSAGAAPMA